MNSVLKTIGNAIIITIAFRIAGTVVDKAMLYSANAIASTKDKVDAFSQSKNG